MDESVVNTGASMENINVGAVSTQSIKNINIAAASTGNINVFHLWNKDNDSFILDNVVVDIDDKVLIKDQDEPTQNGTYTFESSFSTDSKEYILRKNDIQSDIKCFILEGARNKHREFMFVVVDPNQHGNYSITEYVDDNDGGDGVDGGKFMNKMQNQEKQVQQEKYQEQTFLENNTPDVLFTGNVLVQDTIYANTIQVAENISVAGDLSVHGTFDCKSINIQDAKVTHQNLALIGDNQSYITGPHITTFSNTRKNSPTFQLNSWSTDDISLNFNCFYDGEPRLSLFEKGESCCRLTKYKGRFQIQHCDKNNVFSSLLSFDLLTGITLFSTPNVIFSSMKDDSNGSIRLAPSCDNQGTSIAFFKHSNLRNSLKTDIWRIKHDGQQDSLSVISGNDEILTLFSDSNVTFTSDQFTVSGKISCKDISVQNDITADGQLTVQNISVNSTIDASGDGSASAIFRGGIHVAKSMFVEEKLITRKLHLAGDVPRIGFSATDQELIPHGPSLGSTSSGVRIVFSPTKTPITTHISIGVSSSNPSSFIPTNLWSSIPAAMPENQHVWYAGDKTLMSVNGLGDFNLYGTDGIANFAGYKEFRVDSKDPGTDCTFSLGGFLFSAFKTKHYLSLAGSIIIRKKDDVNEQESGNTGDNDINNNVVYLESDLIANGNSTFSAVHIENELYINTFKINSSGIFSTLGSDGNTSSSSSFVDVSLISTNRVDNVFNIHLNNSHLPGSFIVNSNKPDRHENNSFPTLINYNNNSDTSIFHGQIEMLKITHDKITVRKDFSVLEGTSLFNELTVSGTLSANTLSVRDAQIGNKTMANVAVTLQTENDSAIFEVKNGALAVSSSGNIDIYGSSILLSSDEEFSIEAKCLNVGNITFSGDTCRKYINTLNGNLVFDQTKTVTIVESGEWIFIGKIRDGLQIKISDRFTTSHYSINIVDGTCKTSKHSEKHFGVISNDYLDIVVFANESASEFFVFLKCGQSSVELGGTLSIETFFSAYFLSFAFEGSGIEPDGIVSSYDDSWKRIDYADEYMSSTQGSLTIFNDLNVAGSTNFESVFVNKGVQLQYIESVGDFSLHTNSKKTLFVDDGECQIFRNLVPGSDGENVDGYSLGTSAAKWKDGVFVSISSDRLTVGDFFTTGNVQLNSINVAGKSVFQDAVFNDKTFFGKGCIVKGNLSCGENFTVIEDVRVGNDIHVESTLTTNKSIVKEYSLISENGKLIFDNTDTTIGVDYEIGGNIHVNNGKSLSIHASGILLSCADANANNVVSQMSFDATTGHIEHSTGDITLIPGGKSLIKFTSKGSVIINPQNSKRVLKNVSFTVNCNSNFQGSARICDSCIVDKDLEIGGVLKLTQGKLLVSQKWKENSVFNVQKLDGESIIHFSVPGEYGGTVEDYFLANPTSHMSISSKGIITINNVLDVKKGVCKTIVSDDAFVNNELFVGFKENETDLSTNRGSVHIKTSGSVNTASLILSDSSLSTSSMFSVSKYDGLKIKIQNYDDSSYSSDNSSKFCIKTDGSVIIASSLLANNDEPMFTIETANRSTAISVVSGDVVCVNGFLKSNMGFVVNNNKGIRNDGQNLNLYNDSGDLNIYAAGSRGMRIESISGNAIFQGRVFIESALDSTIVESADDTISALNVKGGATFHGNAVFGKDLMFENISRSFDEEKKVLRLHSEPTATWTLTLPNEPPSEEGQLLTGSLNGKLQWISGSSASTSVLTNVGKRFSTFLAENGVPYAFPRPLGGLKMLNTKSFDLRLIVTVVLENNTVLESIHKLTGIFTAGTSWFMTDEVLLNNDDSGKTVSFDISNDGQITYSSPQYQTWLSTTFSWISYSNDDARWNDRLVLGTDKQITYPSAECDGAFLKTEEGKVLKVENVGTKNVHVNGTVFSNFKVDAGKSIVGSLSTVSIKGEPVDISTSVYQNTDLFALKVESGKVLIASVVDGDKNGGNALDIKGSIGVKKSAYLNRVVVDGSVKIGKNGTVQKVAVMGKIHIGSNDSKFITVNIRFDNEMQNADYVIVGNVSDDGTGCYIVTFSGLTTTGCKAKIYGINSDSWNDLSVTLHYSVVVS